ncbi:hypothetical protein [Caldiplasma sukawensis]
MGIDCADLGYAVITKRDGHKIELTIEETVKICEEAMEKGMPIHELIREKYADAKVIRFFQD